MGSKTIGAAVAAAGVSPRVEDIVAAVRKRVLLSHGNSNSSGSNCGRGHATSAAAADADDAAVPDSPITRAGAAAGWSSSAGGATPTHLASVVGGSGVKIFRRYATTARPLLPASAATILLSPATRTSTLSDQHHMAE